MAPFERFEPRKLTSHLRLRPIGPRFLAIRGAEGKCLTYRRTRGKAAEAPPPAPLRLTGEEYREPLQFVLSLLNPKMRNPPLRAGFL